MEFGLALGLVIDLGPVLGQGDTDGETAGNIASNVGDGIADADIDLGDNFSETPTWTQRVLTTIILFITSTTLLIAQQTQKAAEKTTSWYHHVALYIGPEVSFGPFYLTAGGCFGGFGCLAIGGGINLGKNFGIGVLFPIWIWW